MFRQLAKLTSPDRVFLYRPSELSAYLERVWGVRSSRYVTDRPSPSINGPLMPEETIPNFPKQMDWHHLIYAYLIENTEIFDIFDRVLYECLNGERLGILHPESQMWVRNTEELFYKDPWPGSVYSVKSDIRPENSAVRQNAYYRMFGRVLTQATEGDSSYVKPEASNLEFTDTFEELLRETWVGIKNVSNISGEKPTDDQTIANLVRRLSEMLGDRRQFGTLSREEFFAVATMSWFHLTVEFNSPIIVDLRAEGTSAEERLKRVGEKVNLSANPKSDSYFHLAEPMSRILTMIETRCLNEVQNVPTLYNPGLLCNDMTTIITHWSTTSGKMMKASKVAVSP